DFARTATSVPGSAEEASVGRLAAVDDAAAGAVAAGFADDGTVVGTSRGRSPARSGQRRIAGSFEGVGAADGPERLDRILGRGGRLFGLPSATHRRVSFRVAGLVRQYGRHPGRDTGGECQ